MEPKVLDQDVVNLARAIRQHESGGDFNIKGKSGETGAYQFTAPTWRGYAKEVLGDENAPMTPENQNRVAYTKIKKWKDEGKNVGQIASMWNAGEGRPDAYKENHVGVNEYGVHYDTPTYAKKVAEYYQEFKGNKQPTPQTNYPESKSKEPSLGQELLGRTQEGTSAVKEGLSGQQGILSSGLQAAGAVAGGIGDIVTKGLELIPGVKQVEGLIGKGVGKLAQTEGGQKIAGGIQKFSQEHPEASKNIGAIVNIVSAIPILKGVGLAKNLALDATSMALKNQAEKVALRDLTSAVEKTIGGRKALVSNPKALQTVISERALPEIVDNKYTTKEAFEKLSHQISDIEDNKLQPALQKASTQTISDRRPLEQLRKQALDVAEKELKAEGNVAKAKAEINRVFDDYRNSYGDYVSLQDVNDMKRGIRRSVNFNSPKLESDVTYHIGQVLQKDIEQSAMKLGLGDINAINKEMADLIKAQDILKHLEGKSVKTGLIGETIKNAATVGGEMAGSATGIPIAGTLAGRQAGSFVGKKLTGVTQGILKRTGKEAERVSKEELKGKLKGLFGGIAAQKTTNQKKGSLRK